MHTAQPICPTLIRDAEGVPPALRELTRTYQAFDCFASRHMRSQGLTPAQFSVMQALAAGPARSFKQLGEQTLITKGSLTGIVDRLEQKGLAQRTASTADRRSWLVDLTDEGRATFARVARNHFAFLQQALAAFDAADLANIEAGFRRFRQLFNQPSRN
jgi:DNA-binding MarR family transcriptional regulator